MKEVGEIGLTEVQVPLEATTGRKTCVRAGWDPDAGQSGKDMNPEMVLRQEGSARIQDRIRCRGFCWAAPTKLCFISCLSLVIARKRG